MLRMPITPRENWKQFAEQVGFHFHTLDNEVYWDESAYYLFRLSQIERDIEDPTQELHHMCMELVDRITKDETMLRLLCIPEVFWDYIAASWSAREPHIYGRMDLAYNGSGPAKLYELNYDTPTSIYESAFFQWVWFEQLRADAKIPHNADQFNSIEEKLVGAFTQLKPLLPTPLYFACMKDTPEDLGTVTYLRDCAEQAGIATQHIDVEDVGLSTTHEFTDLENLVIPAMFKLHPWEYMFREEFGKSLPGCTTLFLEPPWKSILSNKGILPLLWQHYPGHPNLLPAFFDGEGTAEVKPGWVRKPLFSREGANISLRKPSGELLYEDGPYNDAPYIRQAYHPLPSFQGHYPLIGSWVIADCAAGIGIREDCSPITKNTSRFVPHILLRD